ncbi:Phospholipase/Carboxylesterase [Saccharicrinis carchari]|uniref:Phospholipase/Carboxylesterase n=1 Tax=Saccharicrinis carchari TaxID=1168039 RepID=A0A521EKC9_SACCC|nr:alpha/beta hydrolase-fold protein [Saccharicrinis carchari]SMO84377.1 Phospholipase/Carboxylesterase [Saccharicrinis carchari]
MRTLTIILSSIMFTMMGVLNAQNSDAFIKKEFVKDGATLKYNILYPQKMKSGKKYPLVLFLHGSGERGTDNQKQLTHGSALFLKEELRKKYPAVVLFPQCPPKVMWTHRKKEKSPTGDWEFEFPLGQQPTLPAFLVNELVDEWLASGKIDTRRVYIMGLSMGGIGALDFLYRWPEKYAAANVICGGHDPQLVSAYQHVPIWFFHGAKDDVVPPLYSRQIYEEHKKWNAKTKYTLYPEANHNSWDPAFAEPHFLKWLFKQKK